MSQVNATQYPHAVGVGITSAGAVRIGGTIKTGAGVAARLKEYLIRGPCQVAHLALADE